MKPESVDGPRMFEELNKQRDQRKALTSSRAESTGNTTFTSVSDEFILSREAFMSDEWRRVARFHRRTAQ